MSDVIGKKFYNAEQPTASKAIPPSHDLAFTILAGVTSAQAKEILTLATGATNIATLQENLALTHT